MTLDALRKVMRPKVEGTIYLNELFSQNTLDFFVVFSSATSINGNPGQSAYSAANLFMAALAEQRRRQGLAASVMHIGPIFGIGYIAQAIDETTIFAESTMRSGGYMATSEYDFHQLFAEAVLAGMPGSHAPFEIVSGFRHADSNSLSPPLWLLSPMMSHFIRNHGSTEQAASSASMISVKAQLATARNPDEVFKIVQSAFYAKAESLFQLDSIETSEMDLSSTSLSRMGIDSLSAVEIRGWFLQTMEVNIPVLKILNNASIGELVGIATDSIIAKTTKSSEQTGREEISKNDGGELAPDPLLTTGFLRNNPSETLLGHASNTFALSFSQEMFWFLWSSLSDKSSLNHTGWARIKGKIRVEDLKHAALSMGIHHQILRARFFKQGNVPVQSIMETSRLKLEHRQIKGEHEVQGAAQVLNAAVLDVEQGDSVRLLLLSVSPTTHFLVFAIHPLVMDGFSFQIFLTQLMGLYSNPHLELPMRQYLEHAEKQHKDFESGLFDQELQFWKAEFSTMPPPLPVLKLSSLNTRPRLSVYENETAVLRITKETRSLIQTVCRRYSVTAFHFYLATFRALLERYTEDSSDIVVGVGDANRTEDDMMDVIGPFINLLPVRLRTRSNTKFEDLLEHARLQTLGALQSSRIPFQVLLSRYKDFIPYYAV
jgi:hypothetical protein